MSIVNFRFGKTIEDTVLNGFQLGMNATVIRWGMESIANGHQQEVIRLSQSEHEETRNTANYLRDRSDAFLIFPQGQSMNIEIKYKSNVGSIEDYLTNNYNYEELNRIFSSNPGLRLVLVDLMQGSLRSIYAAEPLNKYSQFENWEKPWTWIPGIKDEDHFREWFDRWIVRTLHGSASKTIAVTEPLMDRLHERP